MITRRLIFLFLVYLIWSIAILSRLFYWQIIAKEKFFSIAENQITKIEEIKPLRGRIFTIDNFPLVLNQDKYLLYAWSPQIEENFKDILKKIATIIFPSNEIGEENEAIKTLAENYFKQSQKKWFLIRRHLSEEQKNQIETLNIKGLSFEKESVRFYPEASMAAQLIGFVGYDEMGNQKGYFGIEGFYQQQLSGFAGFKKSSGGILKWLDSRGEKQFQNGRDLFLFLDRSIQFIIEEELKKGIEKYQAKGGWVVVLNPQEGSIIALAAFPSYNPEEYYQYPYYLFVNPVTTESFEPGSIFKPLIMAAAFEEKVVSLQTKCNICQGPVKIGEYEIKTWNDIYHPNSNMIEIIKNSDNVGMVFVAQNLGLKKMLDYFKKFNLTEKTGIDLQGEIAPPTRAAKDWSPVDLATASFGQGIAITPIQFITAFNSLANGGKIIKPRVVEKISDGEQSWFTNKEIKSQVLSFETCQTMVQILENAVEQGEAKWAKPKGYAIAGKTGTAQIPIAGHYAEEKTIASFIGFAPAENPKFTMLVSLKEPSTSKWGSETAAPLWFSIAKRLFIYWGIPPNGQD